MAVNIFDFNDFKKLFRENITFDELKKLSFNYGMEIDGELTEGEFGVDITPERPDMYSVEGYARALRGFRGIETGLKRYNFVDSDVDLVVDPETKDIRPFIGAAIIKNVQVDDSLIRSIIRFQEKLHFTLGRKRKKIAIGIYDFDKIKPPIYYKAVDPRTVRFTPLGIDGEMNLEEILERHPTGVEYKELLDGFSKYPLLVDSTGNVLSFPPIINSNHSGKVTEKTRNLFVEVTGIHEPTLIKTVTMLATSIIERCGRLERVNIKYKDSEHFSPILEEGVLEVDLGYIRDYLGVGLTSLPIVDSLKRIGYDVEVKNENLFRGTFIVKVPSYRVDVLGPCDVVEDVAIGYGYENFEPSKPNIYSIGTNHPREEFSSHVREICSDVGLTEVMTLVLTNVEDQYSRMQIPAATDYISLLNSKSEGYDIARVRLQPELLKYLRNNKNSETPISIFEVDDVVKVNQSRFTHTEDRRRLAIAEMGANTEFSRMRSIVSAVFNNLGVDYKVTRSNEPFYLPGRAGDIYVNDRLVGNFGEIHPKVLNNFTLELPVAAMEVDLDYIYEDVRRRI